MIHTPRSLISAEKLHVKKSTPLPNKRKWNKTGLFVVDVDSKAGVCLLCCFIGFTSFYCCHLAIDM
jgi:hypothetical protein